MSDYTVRRIDDMDALMGGGFKRARSELGVTSFGMQILDFPPNADAYPEHDHLADGQEEVYLVLRGSGEIDVEGERHAIGPDVAVRVGPAAKRKIYAGPDGLRVVALGGVPGTFEAKPFTEVGAADPTAA